MLPLAIKKKNNQLIHESNLNKMIDEMIIPKRRRGNSTHKSKNLGDNFIQNDFEGVARLNVQHFDNIAERANSVWSF